MSKSPSQNQADALTAKRVAVRVASQVFELVEYRLGAGECESNEAADAVLALAPGVMRSSGVPYKTFRSLLELAAKALGGPDRLSDVIPWHVRSGRTFDVTEGLRTEPSPEALYRILSATGGSVMPLMQTDSRELAPREWEVTARMRYGLEPFPELCAWFAGQPIVLPTLFGYAPARVVQEECQCHGAEACRFRASWDDADGQQREYRVAQLRAGGLERRLGEFEDVVAELVAGESIDDVLVRIVRLALRTSLGSGCVLIVRPDILGAKRLLITEGIESEAAARLADDLANDSHWSGTNQLVFDVRSADNLYGHLVLTGESADVLTRTSRALQTYARLAAAAVSNARVIDQMRYDAMHDALTGAANRALILDRLNQMLVRNRRGSAVLFIDLDGFKQINDTLGHGAGDAVLREVTSRLRAVIREADAIGRLGGDEFVVLLDGETTSAGPETVAKRLIAALAEPFDLRDWSASPAVVTASVGIATGGSSAAEMLRDADVALYSAKQAGKNRFVSFTRELRTTSKPSLQPPDERRTPR